MQDTICHPARGIGSFLEPPSFFIPPKLFSLYPPSSPPPPIASPLWCPFGFTIYFSENQYRGHLPRTFWKSATTYIAPRKKSACSPLEYTNVQHLQLTILFSLNHSIVLYVCIFYIEHMRLHEVLSVQICGTISLIRLINKRM